MIAEIVSLSGYEAQVSALLNEEERMAMEFYIASAPEDHPVIPAPAAFARLDGPGEARGRAAADRNVLARLAAQIKIAAKGGR